ncbi:hypothetical protein [Alterisphingorhabdus coralli]|uniref:Uncharacterized protein n=1 Tax=Alterisphingorhabdus coralli TaxID=3071408 RepID=A0AA97F7T0_9SPHN|nr:hypothetical protein [Parasphingorhabdus sp. SCSIO 66989]WOE75746.1 hypothetical protein RB602_03265 [Parasphingorhabdus sp. SCSIO 66989]
MTISFIVPATVLGLALAAPTGTSEQSTDSAAEEAKAEEKKKKITDRNHPDYVRCRSEPVIGSLAKRRRICMTNAEWAEALRTGNDSSRDFIDMHQQGSTSGVP